MTATNAFHVGFFDEIAKLAEAQIYKTKSKTKSPLTMRDPFEKFRSERKTPKKKNPLLEPGPWRGSSKSPSGSASPAVRARTL